LNRNPDLSSAEFVLEAILDRLPRSSDRAAATTLAGQFVQHYQESADVVTSFTRAQEAEQAQNLLPKDVVVPSHAAPSRWRISLLQLGVSLIFANLRRKARELRTASSPETLGLSKKGGVVSSLGSGYGNNQAGGVLAQDQTAR